MLSRKRIAAAVIAIVVILIVVIYFLADKPYISAVVAAGAIITTIITFILNSRNQEARDLLSDRKEHSRALYDVYKRLMHIYIREERNHILDFKVPVNYEDSFNYIFPLELKERDPELMSVNRIENFDWAVDHLNHKKYESIKQAWANADELREKTNDLTTTISIEKIIENVTSNKLKEAFQSFINADDASDIINKDTYSVQNISKILNQKYNWIMEGDGNIRVIKEAYGMHGHYHVTLYGTTIMTSPTKDNLQEEKIQQVLKAIINDDVLVSKIQALQEAHSNLHVAIQAFEKELEPLVRKLKNGAIIEGKCGLGY